MHLRPWPVWFAIFQLAFSSLTHGTTRRPSSPSLFSRRVRDRVRDRDRDFQHSFPLPGTVQMQGQKNG